MHLYFRLISFLYLGTVFQTNQPAVSYKFLRSGDALYFRKDLSFCVLILKNIRKAGCSAGRLEISDFCDLSFRI